MPETLPSDSRATMRVSSDIKGRKLGHISFPWSRNDSGWGSLLTPFAEISRGDGPTVLVTGGNHGDELEGPVAILDLISTIDIASVRGRIILIPGLNYPALLAGTRVSPIDGGNMNRSFKQKRDGTITEQIAHFVEQTFVASADAVLDMHSGGKSMMFHSFAGIHKLNDPGHMERALAALKAFGTPFGLVMEELDAEGMLDTAVEQRGKLFLTTELGGGGTTTPATMKFARRGLHNFLVHVGALERDPYQEGSPMTILANDDNGYVVCTQAGLIDYLIDLGEPVSQGQPLAKIYSPDSLAAAQQLITAPITGTFLGRSHFARVQAGDFLGLIATPYDSDR